MIEIEESGMSPLEPSGTLKSIFPDDLQAYMDQQAEGTYTLLDVRQPAEYRQAHLPGAKLIPLPELPDSLVQLDSQRKIVVYCAVGGRSRTAALLLLHRGFRDVEHLLGGIEAWEQPTASGPSEFHFQFISGDESAEQMIRLGLQLEEGLRRFHLAVRARAGDKELGELLGQLAGAEENHKLTLLKMAAAPELREELARAVTADAKLDLMEGGLPIDSFMARNEAFLHSVSGYLELAMMIETQALDLYLHMADASRNSAARQVLLRLAEEEKGHLAALGRLLEEKMR